MIPALLLRKCQRAAQQTGRKVHVSIGENQPFPLGMFVGFVHGRAACRAIPPEENRCEPVSAARFSRLRDACHDCPGRILRAVIDGNHFVSGIIECKKCGESAFQ